MRRVLLNSICAVFFASALLPNATIPIAQATEGASLFLQPSSARIPIGETFDVSIYVDTGGHPVNTAEIDIRFPHEKLQIVSPSIGKSVVGIWVAQPEFSNTDGTLRLVGGIPAPGINTERGLIATVRFRARSVGNAVITFGDSSKILLNDGLGTDALSETRGSSILISLPAQEGPLVSSDTHSDQDKWYKTRTVDIFWEAGGPAAGFSYSISGNPSDVPDNVSEGTNKSVFYKDLEDGMYYFHIRALDASGWGKTSHFAFKIDGTPPAKFPIKILPRSRTTTRMPIFDFRTTDAMSGVNHYELKVVPLTPGIASLSNNSETFFFESPERFIPPDEMDFGQYDVIVRAYDNAGNFSESVERLSIVNEVVDFTRDGIGLFGNVYITWGIAVLICIAAVGILSWTLWATIQWRKALKTKRGDAKGHPRIKGKLEKLDRMRKSHGVFAVILSVIGAMYMQAAVTFAKEEVFPPPIVTSISRNITNDQLFYAGGIANIPEAEILIHLQNIQDGQVITDSVLADRKGDWFFTYKDPLLKGSYIFWTQLKLADTISPPSPQENVNVTQTAFQIGASRLSYETIYFLLAILFGLISLVLAGFIGYHIYHGSKERKGMTEEIKEAENAIKDGFLKLKEDIEAELKIIHKAKLSKSLSHEEKTKESKLINDLSEIQAYIQKEFRDVKRASGKMEI